MNFNGRIRHLNDDDVAKMSMSTLGLSGLDYCNVLLVGCPNHTIDILQKIHNKAARVATLSKPHKHITPNTFTGCL